MISGEIVTKYKTQIYYALIVISLTVLAAFSYMTYVFWQTVQGTQYIAWTYLIASPTLFAIILFLALLFVGKEQTTKEITSFVSGNG
jgi:lysylphosphatidylglycerol synthetase-like protein (DUF2156 family)|tara:strand:+ start:860 stop:1120 length:261 start_codon:yes stop_codon:yes gene_type:complete